MRVNFYATFRTLVGAKTVDLILQEEATLGDLLCALAEAHPQLRGAVVDENGALLDQAHVFINGRETRYLPDAVATRLSAEDKIDIFPPIGGGCQQRDLL